MAPPIPSNAPTSTVPASKLRFSVSDFFVYCARHIARALRRSQPRFYLKSPAYSAKQIVVDTARQNSIELIARDPIDIEVIQQVFASEDYRLQRLKRYQDIENWARIIRDQGKHPLILDLGANTGLASLYFARELPDATIIAVEPNQGNARVARINLASYPRIHIVEAGIASSDGQGAISNPGDANWAYRTVIADDGEIPMLSVPTLIDKFSTKNDVPYIVKIDIEGFESNLFANNTGWVDQFPVLIIELHDWMIPGTANSRNFLQLISSRDRDFVYAGENIFSIANNFVIPPTD